MGCGSGMTCWRRLRDWQRAGVWERLHRVLLHRLGRRRPDRLEPGQRRRGAGPGQRGGQQTGPNPTDRGKPGAHHHLVTERAGRPLAVLQTAANVNEGTVLARLVDAIPPLASPAGAPAGRAAARPSSTPTRPTPPAPNRAAAAPAPHHPADRPPGHRLQRAPRAATAGWSSGRWPGCTATAACSSATSGDADLHQAFLDLGCALICWNFAERGG